MLRTLVLALLLHVAVEARPQKPVNNPHPRMATPTATGRAHAQVMKATVMSQTSEYLTVDSQGKRQTFRISERSQIGKLQAGTTVMLTYSQTPQGNEVIKAVAKPGKGKGKAK